MRLRQLRKLALALAILAMATLVVFSGRALASEDSGEAELAYNSFDELDGKTIGVLSGGVYDKLVSENLSGTYTFAFYNNVSDCIAALRSNKIDAFTTDEPVAQLAVNKNDGIGIMPDVVVKDDYGYFFAKGDERCEQFSEVIEEMEADGTLAELKDKWTGADDSAKTLPEQDWDTPNGTLTMTTSGVLEPMTYFKENELVGYDIEVALLICKELGYGLDYSVSDFSGMLAAVPSGKADFGGGSVSITEERKETVDFTTSEYHGALVMVTRTVDDGSGDTNFFDAIADSFRKTFIDEGRWQLILQGLGVTILISVCAGALGTLLGYGTVLARRSGIKWVGKVVDGYDAIIGGIPIVVILMVLYYVVFGSVNIAGEIVAIIAFTLSFGSTSGATMWTAVDSIDTIQEETGLALGYAPAAVFRKIVFPQARQQFMPQLLGQFVSLVKDTAIVGYIAVVDLTRASDLIRARTMDAFFPLIATALIYFLFCRLLAFLLAKLGERFDVGKRPRTIKGVEL